MHSSVYRVRVGCLLSTCCIRLAVFDSLFSQDSHNATPLGIMISENTAGQSETREVSQRQPITTTTTTPTLRGKHTAQRNEERPARPSSQDIGTGGASTPGDACERRALPGSRTTNEGKSPPRVRRRSVVPPKPKPPPVPTRSEFDTATTAKAPGQSAARFCVKPYAPSPRMSRNSPPMPRTTLHAAPNTLPASSPNCVTDDRDSKAAPGPVPPPRRRKNAPKSPGTSRAVLKPDPPRVVTGQPTASKEAVKPPVASPRRSSTSYRSDGKNENSCNGDSVGTSRVAVLPNADEGQPVSGQGSNVQKDTDKHATRKEAAPANIPESRIGCRQGSSGTGGDNSASANSSVIKQSPPVATHPPVPPRLRKKVKGTGSPSSSPKPSRGRKLPQIPQAALKDAENVQLRVTLPQTKVSDPGTQNNAKLPRGNSNTVNAGSTTNTGEVEISWNTTKEQQPPPPPTQPKGNNASLITKGSPSQNTIGHVTHRSPPTVKQNTTGNVTNRSVKQNSTWNVTNCSPPTVKQRRSTLGNRPTPLPPKPAPPPKSLKVRRQSLQQPPVPRPRSFIPSQTQENQVTAAMTNGNSKSSPLQKPSPRQSPRRGIAAPAVRNLATSSPSLLAAVHEATSTPGASQNHQLFTKSPPIARKAGSESPISVHHGRRAGSDSPSRVMAGVLNRRRASLPKSEGASPSHVTSHVTSPGHVINSQNYVNSHVSTPSHVTSHVSSPSHVTSHVSTPSHVSSPSHVTSHVSSPSHVTSHVSTPSHVTSPTTERRGSSSSTSSHRVRVLPTPPPPQPPNSGSLSEGDRAKSLSDILNTPVSPARDLPGVVPPKPPTKRKSASVADILEATADTGKTSDLAREMVKELKRVTGDGVAGEECEGGGGKEGGVRGEPEGAETQLATEVHRNSSNKRNEVGGGVAKKSRLGFAKQRAVSVGDISLLETGPIQSDTSSYTSSEGRASVLSSESPLLERARQLSKNRKWSNQPEVCVCVIEEGGCKFTM